MAENEVVGKSPETECVRVNFRSYKEEYAAAKEIVSLLDKQVGENQKLNLCVIRRFCEIMTNY